MLHSSWFPYVICAPQELGKLNKRAIWCLLMGDVQPQVPLVSSSVLGQQYGAWEVTCSQYCTIGYAPVTQYVPCGVLGCWKHGLWDTAVTVFRGCPGLQIPGRKLKSVKCSERDWAAYWLWMCFLTCKNRVQCHPESSGLRHRLKGQPGPGDGRGLASVRS